MEHAPLVPAIRLNCASVLVVADEQCCPAATAALERSVDADSALVTVVSIPQKGRGFWTAFAPLSGATTPQRIEEEADYRANDTARIFASTLRVSGLSYQVVRGWQRVALMLEGGAYDVAVLGRLPGRRRDLRHLVEVSARSGTALVFGHNESS